MSLVWPNSTDSLLSQPNIIFYDSLNILNSDSIPVWKKNNQSNFALDEPSQNSNIDSSKIDFSGVKTMSISIGESSKSSFEQSLVLRAMGELAPNIFIDAKLSDQDVNGSSGIMSTSVQELDQIYAKIFGKQYYLTLGDLDVDYQSTQLGEIYRSGMGLDAWYTSDLIEFKVSLIKSKGEIKRVEFLGKEAKQKGYYLDENSYTPIVPNSEKVWRNGIILVKNKDYEIDYTSGKIDFLGLHIVNARDEYTVEYQEWAESSSQNLASTHVGLKKDWSRLKWKLNFEWRKLYDDIASTTAANKNPENQDLLILNNYLALTSWMQTNVEIAWSHLDTNTNSNDSGQVKVASAYRYKLWGNSENEKGLFYEYQGLWFDSLYRDINIRFEGSDFSHKWYLDSLSLNDWFKSDELELGLKNDAWKLYNKSGYAQAEVSYASSKSFADSSNQSMISNMISNDSTRRSAGDSYNSFYNQTGLEHKRNWSRTHLDYTLFNVWDLNKKSKDELNLKSNFLWNYFNAIDLIPFSEASLSRYAPSENLYSDYNRFYYSVKTGLRYNNSLSGILKNSSSIRQRFNSTYNGETSVKLENEAIKLGNQFVDSLRAMEIVQSINYRPQELWKGNLLLQYRELRETPIMSYQGGSENYWLAQSYNDLGKNSKGWNFRINYDLTSGEEKPLIPVYKEVPIGTGDFIYDSLENRYIEDLDKGYLVYEGLKTDTSANDYLTRNVGSKMSLELIPKNIIGKNKGFLSDIRLYVAGDWSSQDTTDQAFGGGYIPYFTKKMIDNSVEGRMYLNAKVDWAIDQRRWSFEWLPFRLYENLRGTMETKSQSQEHLFRLENQTHQSLRTHFIYSWFNETREAGITSNYQAQTLETYVSYWLWSLLEMEPGARLKTSNGKYANELLEVYLKQYYLKLKWRFRRSGDIYANYTHSQVIQNKGNSYAYGATEGYDKGITHRVELGSYLDLSDILKLRLRYVFRKEPEKSDIYQTMSAELSAYF